MSELKRQNDDKKQADCYKKMTYLLAEILIKKENEWGSLKKPCPMCGYTNPRKDNSLYRRYIKPRISKPKPIWQD